MTQSTSIKGRDLRRCYAVWQAGPLAGREHGNHRWGNGQCMWCGQDRYARVREKHRAGEPRSYFLLIKHQDETTSGRPISAHKAATALLEAGMWPLLEHTRNKRLAEAGDYVAIYLAGTGQHDVVATARIADKVPWDRELAKRYPLALRGIPSNCLLLDEVQMLRTPIHLPDRAASLSFVTAGARRWGTSLMGGMRSIREADFQLLTT